MKEAELPAMHGAEQRNESSAFNPLLQTGALGSTRWVTPILGLGLGFKLANFSVTSPRLPLCKFHASDLISLY